MVVRYCWMIGVVRVLFEWIWGIPIGEELRAEDLPFPSLCRLLSYFTGILLLEVSWCSVLGPGAVDAILLVAF